MSDEKSARTYLNTVATRLKDDVDTLKNNFTALNRVCNAWPMVPLLARLVFLLLEGGKLEDPTFKQAREDGTVGEAVGTKQRDTSQGGAPARMHANTTTANRD